MGLDLVREMPVRESQVHGLPLEEICADPYLMIVPEERKACGRRPGQIAQRTFFQSTAHERLANGELWHFRILTMPIWDPDGTYLGRCGLKYPVRNSSRCRLPCARVWSSP